jgi:TatD DNase family protein|tara:strand:+ start:762 stop:1532 length:771 start_codon:yes stop_codon:yes gene_type:complete
MFIDSHCHLDLLAQEEGGIDLAINNAKENGVDHILCISIDKSSCHKIIEIVESNTYLSASVGIHPNIEQTENFTVEELVSLANHEKVIAIGETGLDYFRSEGDLGWQRERFRVHVEAAKELKKPLIVHTREARKDTMDILENEDAKSAGGIIHCFTEDWETAKRALDIGFYISLSGIVTFKNARELQEVAKKLPLDRILIETDSPYLAPVPHRGKTNQPAFVRHVAEFLATLRGDSIENIAKTTTDNFHTAFPTTK